MGCASSNVEEKNIAPTKLLTSDEEERQAAQYEQQGELVKFIQQLSLDHGDEVPVDNLAGFSPQKAPSSEGRYSSAAQVMDPESEIIVVPVASTRISFPPEECESTTNAAETSDAIGIPDADTYVIENAADADMPSEINIQTPEPAQPRRSSRDVDSIGDRCTEDTDICNGDTCAGGNEITPDICTESVNDISLSIIPSNTENDG